MAVILTKHPPATIECITAFSRWFGLSPLDSDIDIQTDVAWDHWQHAWHAAKRDSDREQAENATLQAAWRIADEASRELVEGHGMRVDHVTISLDADEIASAPALEEAIDYLENRGIATRMDAPDEVLVIFENVAPGAGGGGR
ncbi:hypothetical protein [Xenophilus sp. Marseille-Q4582]|uniref:hypothetical protein n=1 Tax=Xenophilus sp. Marseille-Q4582 TaxID=2866600 RepID=UPI001CE46F2B|nr:hypothetical protein [Xenophilus sp. Marseille-Q4582]